MKWFGAALLVAILAMQYRLWISGEGWSEVTRLQSSVSAQAQENARLLDRNAQLAAEVRDLKQGYVALEERARSELGMIAGNETFYQVVPAKADDAAAAPAAPKPGNRTAAR